MHKWRNRRSCCLQCRRIRTRSLSLLTGVWANRVSIQRWSVGSERLSRAFRSKLMRSSTSTAKTTIILLATQKSSWNNQGCAPSTKVKCRQLMTVRVRTKRCKRGFKRYSWRRIRPGIILSRMIIWAFRRSIESRPLIRRRQLCRAVQKWIALTIKYSKTSYRNQKRAGLSRIIKVARRFHGRKRVQVCVSHNFNKTNWKPRTSCHNSLKKIVSKRRKDFRKSRKG